MTQEEQLARLEIQLTRIEKHLDDIVKTVSAVAQLAQKNREDITTVATQLTQLAGVVAQIISNSEENQNDVKGLQVEVRRLVEQQGQGSNE